MRPTRKLSGVAVLGSQACVFLTQARFGAPLVGGAATSTAADVRCCPQETDTGFSSKLNKAELLRALNFLS
jgi:hypothetical protein